MTENILFGFALLFRCEASREVWRFSDVFLAE